MAPAILRGFFANAAPVPVDASALGPIAAREVLAGRDLVPRSGDNYHPGAGTIDPHNINNVGLFVLFGLIGVAFVVTGIWFFFWAKNGGFYFKEGDWEEYKSTVLRRKGPNGTILSNATPSTNLGGGSIYKDVDDRTTTVSGSTNQQDEDDRRTTVTDSTYMTGITAGVSDIGAREKRRLKKEARDRDRERRREEKAQAKANEKAEKEAAAASKKKSSKRHVKDGEMVVDEEAEAEAKEHLRSYRHERAARVGGINKESEASTWDGSTNPSASSAGPTTEAESTVTSELLAGRQRTPTSTPTKKTTTTTTNNQGIRKVYSTADRNAEREAERIRAEARRLQEKGRSAMSSSSSAAGGGSGSGVSSTGSPRRDFSFQRADDSRRGPLLRRIEECGGNRGDDDRETRVPGSWTESEVGGASSDLGTKTYHHPIPELSSSLSGCGIATNDFAYQDEKRKNRRAAGGGGGSGYRRG